ncbi:MAG TPA: NINE protein [Clostridium sp.]|uniref:TM2 domain-containing protein n=1 Tax=Clostridium sp. TaxID=1506 RepID=UPI002F937571
MFCPKCGSRNDKGSNFCKTCGINLLIEPVNMTYSQNISKKNWLVTLLLCVFLGAFGVHRFYTGKIGTGILMLITAGGFGIWIIFDVIMIATNSFRDVKGLELNKSLRSY